jgi:hypothetical protein
MKRFLFLAIALIAAGSLWAQIDLGNFPLGSWSDSNYDAIWTFTSGNIKIVDADGTVYFDFEGKTIEDWKISTTTEGIVISFGCVESARDYEIVKPLSNVDLILRIKREGLPDYETTMKRN